MNTIGEKLEYLNDTKHEIKSAINEKTPNAISNITTFRKYADAIRNITTDVNLNIRAEKVSNDIVKIIIPFVKTDLEVSNFSMTNGVIIGASVLIETTATTTEYRLTISKSVYSGESKVGVTFSPAGCYGDIVYSNPVNVIANMSNGPNVRWITKITRIGENTNLTARVRTIDIEFNDTVVLGIDEFTINDLDRNDPYEDAVLRKHAINGTHLIIDVISRNDTNNKTEFQFENSKYIVLNPTFDLVLRRDTIEVTWPYLYGYSYYNFNKLAITFADAIKDKNGNPIDITNPVQGIISFADPHITITNIQKTYSNNYELTIDNQLNQGAITKNICGAFDQSSKIYSSYGVQFYQLQAVYNTDDTIKIKQSYGPHIAANYRLTDNQNNIISFNISNPSTSDWFGTIELTTQYDEINIEYIGPAPTDGIAGNKKITVSQKNFISSVTDPLIPAQQFIYTGTQMESVLAEWSGGAGTAGQTKKYYIVNDIELPSGTLYQLTGSILEFYPYQKSITISGAFHNENGQVSFIGTEENKFIFDFGFRAEGKSSEPRFTVKNSGGIFNFIWCKFKDGKCYESPFVATNNSSLSFSHCEIINFTSTSYLANDLIKFDSSPPGNLIIDDLKISNISSQMKIGIKSGYAILQNITINKSNKYYDIECETASTIYIQGDLSLSTGILVKNQSSTALAVVESAITKLIPISFTENILVYLKPRIIYTPINSLGDPIATNKTVFKLTSADTINDWYIELNEIKNRWSLDSNHQTGLQNWQLLKNDITVAAAGDTIILNKFYYADQTITINKELHFVTAPYIVSNTKKEVQIETAPWFNDSLFKIDNNKITFNSKFPSDRLIVKVSYNGTQTTIGSLTKYVAIFDTTFQIPAVKKISFSLLNNKTAIRNGTTAFYSPPGFISDCDFNGLEVIQGQSSYPGYTKLKNCKFIKAAPCMYGGSSFGYLPRHINFEKCLFKEIGNYSLSADYLIYNDCTFEDFNPGIEGTQTLITSGIVLNCFFKNTNLKINTPGWSEGNNGINAIIDKSNSSTPTTGNLTLTTQNDSRILFANKEHMRQLFVKPDTITEDKAIALVDYDSIPDIDNLLRLTDGNSIKKGRYIGTTNNFDFATYTVDSQTSMESANTSFQSYGQGKFIRLYLQNDLSALNSFLSSSSTKDVFVAVGNHSYQYMLGFAKGAGTLQYPIKFKNIKLTDYASTENVPKLTFGKDAFFYNTEIWDTNGQNPNGTNSQAFLATSNNRYYEFINCIIRKSRDSASGMIQIANKAHYKFVNCSILVPDTRRILFQYTSSDNFPYIEFINCNFIMNPVVLPSAIYRFEGCTGRIIINHTQSLIDKLITIKNCKFETLSISFSGTTNAAQIQDDDTSIINIEGTVLGDTGTYVAATSKRFLLGSGLWSNFYNSDTHLIKGLDRSLYTDIELRNEALSAATPTHTITPAGRFKSGSVKDDWN